jgi:DNA-binding Xre family transcriptional regulator
MCVIKVSIKEVAMSKGVDTGYKLQQLTGVQPNLAYKWFENKLQSISIKSLNTLCEALKCEPQDILVYTPGEPQP